MKIPPVINQHASWISIDPVLGCPSDCAYCYLRPLNLQTKIPRERESNAKLVYDMLQESLFFRKRANFVDVTQVLKAPIAIGNYSDICMTSGNRKLLLSLLYEHKLRIPHIPVCIPTKAVLNDEFLYNINEIGIKVIFFISLSFFPFSYEKRAPSIEARLENFEKISKYSNIKSIHWWRPLTTINTPTLFEAEEQLSLVKKAGAEASVLVGLAFDTNLLKMLCKERNPLYELLKPAMVNIHHSSILEHPNTGEILCLARDHSYPLFLHTSCAVSYLLEQPDYNATFRKTHLFTKCEISICPPEQKVRCFSFKRCYTRPSSEVIQEIADFLDISLSAVRHDQPDETILVEKNLTQAEQIFLTQVTGFVVKSYRIKPTLYWMAGWRSRS